MKKQTLRTAAALVLGASMMVGNSLAATVSFQDVPSNHWAYSYVKKAAEKGLVSGIGNGKYGVDQQLSTAHFATMLSGLLYSNAATAYPNTTSYWWYSYMEAAYQKGYLSGTTAGNRRAADGKWTASVVEAGMSRYDLAQIIYNVSQKQGWESPTSTELFFAMASIADWSEIPTQYQNAVTLAYAKQFLSGVDSKGTFGGKTTMTRGQAAVVLSAISDAKTKMDSPTYTNRSGKLVNGNDANEDNVKSALKTLQYEFYEYDIWDTARVYTSAKLGSGSGNQGFIYMLSDRVFGALPVQTQTNTSRLKPGDVVYLRSSSQYVLVTDVSRGQYSYVTCDSKGIISWRGSGDVDDLSSKDTIYTRYEGEADNELDEDDVADLIDKFLDREYEVGDSCYEAKNGYTSTAFYKKEVTGSRAFAYYMSDYIFGDDAEVDSERGSDVDFGDIRLGDVINVYNSDEKGYVYGVVTALNTNKKRITYVYTDSKNYVTEASVLYSALDEGDTIYTRYAETVSSKNTLSNGKDATEKNVRSLLSDLEDEYSGETWKTERYTSSVLGKGRSYSQSFAYSISDEIFGKLDETTSTKFSKMRVGDVLYLDAEEMYVVILSVDTSKGTYTYAYAKESSKNGVTISWGNKGYLDDLDGDDEYYTRYPD